VDTFGPESRVFVAGHRGLVGSGIMRRLARERFARILTVGREQLDLRDQAAVNYWFKANRPEYVFLVAGTVGGILANMSRPADFLFDNLMIHATVVHAAHLYPVKKLLYLGSSCAYPREADQPIAESALLEGPLEPTNEPYAVAKIAGIKMCQSYRTQYGCNFISAMPTNLYGPHDNFDLCSSHVLPAMIAKFHSAKAGRAAQVTLWGTGTPRREFLHVDDLADCCMFLMRHYHESQHINIGTGVDVSIRELAALIQDEVYPEATVVYDETRPNGTPRKVLDVARLRSIGWTHNIGLQQGISSTYRWYVEHEASQVARSAVGAS
jgi:GDP-L-fucose synthase